MPKERNKADGYREKAYEGDTKAMNNLGVCYERGTGVKVSLELAFEWYMKAAELGGRRARCGKGLRVVHESRRQG